MSTKSGEDSVNIFKRVFQYISITIITCGIARCLNKWMSAWQEPTKVGSIDPTVHKKYRRNTNPNY